MAMTEDVREQWQLFYGELVPINQSVIDVWRIYYDDMEALDRAYPHGPGRRGSNSVVPTVSAKWHPYYYRERHRIKDTLHIMLGRNNRSPTSAGYSEQDMARHEHEKAMKRCDCVECLQY